MSAVFAVCKHNQCFGVRLRYFGEFYGTGRKLLLRKWLLEKFLASRQDVYRAVVLQGFFI